MPRTSTRKTDRGLFKDEDMRAAVDLVIKKKRCLREAAKHYKLSFQTLHRYVSKEVKYPGTFAHRAMVPKYDARKILTSEQEKELAEYMITCSKMCYGKSTRDFRKIAFEMANKNSLPMPKTWIEKKEAGLDWLRGFLKRNPNISIRQPEGCSLSRATAFNPHNVGVFFSNYDKALQRSEKFADGSRIYNLDETGVTTVHHPKRVVAEKGCKQVGQIISAERGTLVTVCCIINAAGNTIPPAMVFPRKNFKQHMISGAVPGTLGLANQSGWMTAELFPEVMTHFVNHSRSSKDDPTILVMDNHESHLSLLALDIAKDNGVTVVTLPPHCSHRMQPLDVSVYRSFKAHINSAMDSWLLHHPGCRVSIYEIAAFVKFAHENAMTPANILSGFQKTGIFPFNKFVFSEQDFLASSVTDISNSDDMPIQENCAGRQNPQGTMQGTADDPSVIPDSPSSTPNENGFSVSPVIALGFPKAQPKKTQRKSRQKGKSIIATDTPEKLILMERLKNKRKECKTVSGRKPVTKRLNFDSTDDEDDDAVINLDDTDDSVDDFVVPDPTSFEELDREPTIDDYVLVEFSCKKNLYYIGQVTKEKDNEGDYEVTFLRKCKKSVGTKFVHPAVPDIASICTKDIKMILPQPVASGKTKRQQAFLSFEIDFKFMNMQ